MSGTQNPAIPVPAPTGWRFRIGLSIFVLGWLCPLFVPLVTRSGLSIQAKTFLSGILLVGVPEVLSVVSIAILGKEGFNYIKMKFFSLLKKVVPRAKVSRTRYRVGLFLLLPHLIFAYFIFYAPHLIWGYAENRIIMNLCADTLFIITLFILGGDFWEKLRALFLYDAKAHFPDNAEQGGAQLDHET